MMEQWVYHDRLKLWLLSESQRERKERGALWLEAQEGAAHAPPVAPAGKRLDRRPTQRKPGPDWGYFTP